MSEQGPGATGVQERDGAFYFGGEPITEEEARAHGWEPAPAELDLTHEEVEGDVDGEPTNGAVAPESIFDSLREAYALTTDTARLTVQIAPGRYGGNLAMRLHKGNWKDYRKQAERVERKGGGEDALLQFAAAVIVARTETILFRPDDDTSLLPLHQCRTAWRDGAPVCFDSRLAEAAGIELTGSEKASDICRLVFKTPGALNDAFVTVDAWLREAIPSDPTDEDGEDEDGRPT